MGTCSTCKHWERQTDDWLAAKVGFRLCARVRPRWKVEDDVPKEIAENRYDGDTTEKLYDKAEAEVFSRTFAYVQDGSEYLAELITAGNFGCVLHDPIA